MELPEFEVLEKRIGKVCQLVSGLKKENKELSEKMSTLAKKNEELKKLKEEVKNRVEGIIGKLELLE